MVAGRIDSVQRRHTRHLPEGLPDAPVTKFVLTMKAGRRGVFVNAENLCAKPLFAGRAMIGHNNRGWRLHPPLQASCKKRKARGKRGRGNTETRRARR